MLMGSENRQFMPKRIRLGRLGLPQANSSLFKPITLVYLSRQHGKSVMYQSVPSLTIPPGDPQDSHILVAPGVGFLLLCLAQGSQIKVKV